jgi:PadR family transcriptional regulator PadR
MDHPAPRSKRPSSPSKEVRAAWALLLLDEGATHGYELRRRLAWHRLKVDLAGVYRLLRELERDGWVQSRWLRASAGPRRRLYRLTPAGRENLDEMAAVIDEVRDTHDRFLRAYNHALRRRLSTMSADSEPRPD